MPDHVKKHIRILLILHDLLLFRINQWKLWGENTSIDKLTGQETPILT